MKTRWFIGVLILIATVAVALMFVFRPREPDYHHEPLSYWVSELRNANPGRQQQAQKALREIGAQAVPFLLRMARSEGSVLKRCYREAWFRLPGSVQTRLRQPESEDAALSFISHALHLLGPAAGPALMKAIEDPNSRVRLAAAGAFPYGHDSPGGVAWLMKMLQMPDYEPQQSAAMALGMTRTEAAPAIHGLVRAMQRDGFDYVRETAARSVANLVGPKTGFAAPELKKSLTDPLPRVRLWSAVALWRISRDCGAIPVLIADLKTASAEDGTCHAVIGVLGEAGALARPAVPGIRTIMLQFDPERLLPEGAAALIQTAREALAQIDPETDPVDMFVP